MPYVPNPADPTQPVGTVDAGTADDEFRALKGYLQSLVFTGTSGSRVAVRQSVQDGDKNSSGNADIIGIGALLTADLKAAVSNAVMAFAGGFSGAGAVDYIYSVSAAVGYWTGLTALVTNYLSADYVDNVTPPVATKYLVPPQYGFAFDRTRGALLNFEGADASTTMIDDFGNTWTASGNAQIDTAQFKFGASSLLLDGTGDFISSTNFASLGVDSWEISCWFRMNALPGVGANEVIFAAQGTAGFGVICNLHNTAGTIQLQAYLSSNNSAHNISNGGLGTFTGWATNTWYRIRVVFDALAGTYRYYLSNNGAAETQDFTVSSSLRICNIAQMRIGRDITAGIGDFNGWIDGFQYMQASSSNSVIAVPSTTAPVITNYPYNFFDVTAMKMYEVTAASVTAGVNPTLTAKNRLFVGEIDMGAVTGASVRSYAFQGKFFGTTAGVGVSTGYVLNHNLGIPRELYIPEFVARGVEVNSIYTNWAALYAIDTTPFVFGVEVDAVSPLVKRNSLRGASGAAGSFFNSATFATAAQYQIGLKVTRSF